MMRSIVCGASWVCSVANTRWPVSAAVIAVEIVSRSRISPTRMTSGSWRRTCLSALPNPCVSAPDLALVHDARLVLVQELDRVLDGHDVTRPLGVDDVDHRRPASSTCPNPSGRSPRRTRAGTSRGRRPRREARARRSCLISKGITRKAAPTESRCMKTFTRNRARPGSEYDMSSSSSCSKRSRSFCGRIA